jgi:murein DD-endopeptidase MepM/ murein hydrolase activator NlpD
MNIILVGYPFKGSKSINLKQRATQIWLASVVIVAISLLFLTSFTIGQWSGDRRGYSKHALESLRQQLATQQLQVNEAQANAQRDVNALATQLADLQAQAARLNALGQRLTKLGKLDSGEFNFAQAPATGGPEIESTLPARSFVSGEFAAELNKVRTQFNQQAQQLDMLQSFLLDRDLDASLFPSGMPVRSGYMSSNYGVRVDPINGNLAMHAGVDFPGLIGSDILAVADGVVTWSGVKPGYGNVVDVDHGNGYKTRYAHNLQNLVKVGDRVHSQQLIAQLGSTGRSTGAHCHFEVWFDGKPINPTEFVRAIR